MKITILSSVCALCLATCAAHAQSYTVQELPGGGYANSMANAVIGGTLSNHATLWLPSGPIDLNPVGSEMSGINECSGTISAGFAGAGQDQYPMYWDGLKPNYLSVPFAFAFGRAVATDGQQVVGNAYDYDVETGVGKGHALLWDLTTQDVVDLGKDMQVFGVGGSLQVGVRFGSKGSMAGYWAGNRNSFTNLHPRGYDASVASDTDGKVEVGYVGVDVRVRHEARPRKVRYHSAVVWSGNETSYETLFSPYEQSFAKEIEGDTIVGHGNHMDIRLTYGPSHAVAWVGPNHEFVDIHSMLPVDMRTSTATGVDENGNIVGFGLSNSGQLRSFVWYRN